MGRVTGEPAPFGALRDLFRYSAVNRLGGRDRPSLLFDAILCRQRLTKPSQGTFERTVQVDRWRRSAPDPAGCWPSVFGRHELELRFRCSQCSTEDAPRAAGG
jgi:hypothetical protein